MIGSYFDTFLKKNNFEDSKERILYAKNRVYLDFKNAETDLIQGLKFIQTDDTFIASMELINNYQNKDDYNSVLLDEEKKLLTETLLYKVKNSFTQSIKIYDKNEELVAYVYKDEKGYKLNFISYEKSKKILYSKYEDDKQYSKNQYVMDRANTFKHVDYYSQPELKETTLITHHLMDNKICITSHDSIFNKYNDTETIVHIEMSKQFDHYYFKKISDDLHLNISLGTENKYEKKTLLLAQNSAFKDSDILNEGNYYLSVFLLNTEDVDAFILFSLDKSLLNRVLNNNREQLVLFLTISIVIILVIFNFLIRIGIYSPLDQLMQQISKIKNRDYSESKIVKTADELEEISKNINTLATSLNNREHALKISQSKLEYLSSHDELTGLLNRRNFALKLEYAIQKANRYKTKVAVLFLDLDQFKQVNDTLGHTIGDNLLKTVANRLKLSLRDSDVLARVGGDEFNIFIDDFKSIVEVQSFAQKLIDDLEEPYIDEENEIISSVSIGISLFPEDGKDIETLIKNADLAMYKAKDAGRNDYSFYSSKFSESLQNRMNIMQCLKSAIKNKDEFLLYYQPKISIKTQKIVGVEALIRWNSPERGFVRPDEFIAIAEETHIIIEIGDWVLNRACKDFMALKNDGYDIRQVSVNVSGVQLQYSDMLQSVSNAITSTNIKAHELELEVTESYIATNEEEAIETLAKFRDMGIELAIDDFGTGYSSMSYLQKLPMSRLKIDKAFVDDLPNSAGSVAVVNAIIALAQAFDLKVTVEGVELKEQLDFFKDKYCDDIQGYYYSKPLSLVELKEFIKNRSTNQSEKKLKPMV